MRATGFCVIHAIAVMGVSWAARGGEPPAPKPLVLHARLREAAPRAGGGVHGQGEDPGVGAGEDGDHHLRHVGPALVQGGDAPGRRAGAGDEPGGQGRARAGRPHHPRPEQLHGSLQGSPGSQARQAAPKAANLPADIDGWCNKIPAEEKGIYPIDQADGGCDDGPRCPEGSPWRSQIAAIEIRDEDAISDSGVEIWNLLESRGITHVMLMGVHTNMCVLGRPFGLRQLARHGKNVVLVRDLTDTMYNSRSWPYVSHFEGTNRIIEHIEKYVCPTITSTDLTGQPAFTFQPDDRPRAVFVIGEDEYKTEKTLPAFANSSSSRWASAARS